MLNDLGGCTGCTYTWTGSRTATTPPAHSECIRICVYLAHPLTKKKNAVKLFSIAFDLCSDCTRAYKTAAGNGKAVQ